MNIALGEFLFYVFVCTTFFLTVMYWVSCMFVPRYQFLLDKDGIITRCNRSNGTIEIVKDMK